MQATKTNTWLTLLLGFNAGYVDTAGFLALAGLFTAHVTGNFVTLGAALIHGTSGAWPKLAALPVFCLMVMVTRIASHRLVARRQAPVKCLILVKVALLIAAAGLMVAYGPFEDSNAWPAFLAGMLMVGAMAMQNAMQRIHLKSTPPSTLMTGNTTQVMMDLTDLLKGAQGTAREQAVARLKRMLPAIAVFAVGCALAALAYVGLGMWCFALPPVVAALAVPWAYEEAA
ncbi:YoaK family protein [Diaphorobacter caeni]|uniref:YoaK family protein n=1 Tax=Diaphorobacter caeni TaxID=2784387 RepID=UPI0018903AD3|nr:YoaK family protein [Diaphorobacter caeni]MBF5007339.1 DUF1275 domain-containing protein [Diaphorobacter caeni]